MSSSANHTKPDDSAEIGESGDFAQPFSTATVAPSPHDDPYDLASLRISQDYATETPVRKLLTVVPVRKPTNQEWFRVRPGEAWRLTTVVLDYGPDHDLYLVSNSMQAELVGETRTVCLVTCVNRQGDLFLWALRLPGPDGRPNLWNESALAAAKLAEAQWVRMKSNRSAQSYEAVTPVDPMPDPIWPEFDLQAIIKFAFGGRLINAADHPVLRELRGAL